MLNPIFPGSPVILLVLSCAGSVMVEKRSNQQVEYLRSYWRTGSVTRASGLRTGGCGFDLRLIHTNNNNNNNITKTRLFNYIENFTTKK